MVKTYVPERGDFVWLEFDPQVGHEQSGRRPAIILSPTIYNKQVGLAIACPITKQIKGYPFEVHLPENSKITGSILSDQVKSVDWQKRKARFIAKAPFEIVEDTLAKLQTILGIQN